MTYKAYKSSNPSKLIDEYFEFKVSNKALPFQSIVLPLGKHSLAYTYKGENKLTVNNKNYSGKGLIVTGQTTRSYKLNVDENTKCCGVLFHPTTFYKLTQVDVSKINDKHLPLNEVSQPLFEVLNSFFQQKHKGKKALHTLEELINTLPLKIDNHTENIDKAIYIINKKKGQISINDLIEKIPTSQKTLETKFKQIVGLTPKKYARLYRFSLLMRKYHEKELKIIDLVRMYNFHDGSHFSKEFKYFMKKSPKSYFSNESEFIKKYLK
ncbi:helix-turn-helix domain-containing protein [Lacinutrix sp. 5H-3-7-4]|uniref:helix-turn-helix domain-containing protein n=1 Tax=Lacinutrix sp. (strain 5H-3-7-4) TaxID=983544 RepID=UPI00020A3410|nr:helix-turn-helix domain-containing protein [Lacinutrix sp. 5H-3-7-4]AEH01818.1 helix-turn-helix domain-containing protein AraC type [Lacinutrix sp. 5H-3-7-4]